MRIFPSPAPAGSNRVPRVQPRVVLSHFRDSDSSTKIPQGSKRRRDPYRNAAVDFSQNILIALVDGDEGICIFSGIPPSPRSVGIIGLERKCKTIYRAHPLTG